MLTMRDHGVEDYVALRDMDATDVGELGEDDRACLKELGEYLVATDAWQRFAIWLLHKHFEPASGEVFVERAIATARRTETTPAERSAFSAGLSATALSFDPSVSSGVGVIGMEFAEPGDFGASSPLSADDETVLAGIAERLQAHGKIERFGVRLIRDPLDVSAHELLVETCDSEQRTLYCDVGERGADLGPRIIETTWRWRVVEGNGERTVMQECQAACAPAIAEGHDIRHQNFLDDDFGND
jgi:hypothetical protein